MSADNSIIIYCTCQSTKRGILEQLPVNPLIPNGMKRVMPSFICPDCRKHRPLSEVSYQPSTR